MLTVGENSYITVAMAGEYIAGHYRGTDPARLRWEGLEDEVKEVLLLTACEELEALPFTGRKATPWQPMAFPRIDWGGNRTDEIPDTIKAAQAELALWLSDDNAQAQQDKRRQLQAQGVQSFSLGDLSESYVAGSAETPLALLYPVVKRLLSRWLNGGYATC